MEIYQDSPLPFTKQVIVVPALFHKQGYQYVTYVLLHQEKQDLADSNDQRQHQLHQLWT